MAKYKVAGTWQAHIDVVEVEKETETSVWVKGGRRAKASSYENYFDTWEEARDFMMAKAQKEVDSARLQLERVKGYYGNWKGLKKPETP